MAGVVSSGVRSTSAHLFRRAHIVNVLQDLFSSLEASTGIADAQAPAASATPSRHAPLDSLLSRYFRACRSIGSTDRLAIADAVYDFVRWKLLIEFSTVDSTACLPLRERIPQLVDAYFRPDSWRPLAAGRTPGLAGLSPNIRCSFPEHLFDCIVAAHRGNAEAAFAACLSMNQKAPVTLRVNRSRAKSRDEVLHALNSIDPVRPAAVPCEHSADGVRLLRRLQVTDLDLYRQGLVDIQDEGSQLVGMYAASSIPKDRARPKIIDFCAGAGGKSLSLGNAMAGHGVLYLHDVRMHALQEARRRLGRAGITNVQFSLPPRVAGGLADLVLVDAPCSGTGTLRRNPDLKWRSNSLERIRRLVELQQSILRDSIGYLNTRDDDARLVYATCSLLPEENEGQVEWAAKELGLVPAAQPLVITPNNSSLMDGFFAVTLRRQR